MDVGMVCGAERRWRLAIGLICLVTAFSTSTGVWAQDEPPEAERAQVFLPARRELRQRLYRAQQALQDKQYSRAVPELIALLEGGEPLGAAAAESEDYFLTPADGSGTRTSLRTEALRLLGSMPEAGRELYELQFGADARQQLQEGIKAADFRLISEVTRRYPHTLAAYDAAMLLGRDCLDRGRPLAAVLVFRGLTASPAAAKRYGEELPLLLAVSWRLAGHPQEAAAALMRLKREFPAARFTVAGNSRTLFEEDGRAVAWLDELFGPRRPVQGFAESEWAMFRGDAARNAESAGGLPLMHLRWSVPVANDPSDESVVQQLGKQYVDQGLPAMPSLQPLAVGETVLMRTAGRLVAIDLRSGKRIWEYPWWDEREDASAPSDWVVSGSKNSLRTQQIQQRIWDDAPYGQMSSDGRSVFLLDGLGFALMGAQHQQVLIARGIQRQNPAWPRTHNQLVALNLAGQGKIRWKVGDETGEDEPLLAGAFFLGAPLPVAGQLYVLAEIRGEIRLVVLDADTGRLQWSQQLAHVDVQTIVQDVARRLVGATVSLADGVLVCPTSAGAIVGVDVSTRTLLWGFEYGPSDAANQQRAALWQMGTYAAPMPQPGSRWADATATIAEGRVIVTPVDSDKLYCLDVVTGKPVWGPRLRGDALYVACVRKGLIVLVGQKSVRAVRLSDGAEAWKSPVLLPSNAMPAGRGFVSGDSYYLATTAPDLVQIDLDSGRLEQVVGTERPLGNLICYRAQVLCQSAERLDAYYQTEPLRTLVEQRLREAPQDPWALEHQALLTLARGDRPEAMAALRQALAQLPADDPRREGTQALLVKVILAALRDDFDANGQLALEVEELIDQPAERAEYLRLMAEGMQRAGELSRAFEAYLKLAELSAGGEHLPGYGDSAPELQRVDRQLSVRADRWIQLRIADLLAAADADQRREIDAQVEARWQRAQQDGTVRGLREFLCYFEALPVGRPARLLLARRMLEGEEYLRAELLLSSLLTDDDPAVAAAAAALLAQVFQASRRWDAAAACYQRLRTEWPDVVCLDGRTGAQLVESLPVDDDLGRSLARAAVGWPTGRVEIRHARVAETDGVPVDLHYPVTLDARRGPISNFLTAAWNHRENTLVVRDGSGREYCRAGLTGPDGRQIPYRLMQGVAHGHLMVISMGLEILGVDMIDAARGFENRVLWRYDLSQTLPADVNRFAHLRTEAVAHPWGAPWQLMVDAHGNLIGQIGPVGPGGVVFQRLRELHCVDPVSGRPIWVRNDVAPGSDLFGDEEYLFVVPPRSNQARVLSTRDGRELGQRAVPPRERRWTTHGRCVLTWEDVKGKRTLRLHDAWAARDVWTRAVAQGARGCVVEGEQLAVFEPGGAFVLIEIADGKTIVDTQLEPEPSLSEIRVLRLPDRYLLATTVPFRARPERSVRAVPTMGDAPLIHGRLYAFDRGQGRKLWQAPAFIDQYALPMNQPRELPVLFLVRHVTITKPNRGHQVRTSVLGIDTRDGRLLLAEEDLPFQTQTCDVTGRPDTQTVELRLANERIYTLQFTNEPRPPEPTAQTGAAASNGAGRRSGLESLTSALFHAWGRTGVLEDILPQEDLFSTEEGQGGDDPFR